MGGGENIFHFVRYFFLDGDGWLIFLHIQLQLSNRDIFCGDFGNIHGDRLHNSIINRKIQEQEKKPSPNNPHYPR